MRRSSISLAQEEILINIIQRIRRVGFYEQLISDNKPEWIVFQKKFLLSIYIQKLYSELYHFFHGLYTVNTKDLLVAYMLLYYEVEKDENFNEVKESAYNLIQCIHTDAIDSFFRSKLYQRIHRFERLYIPWKIDDRERILKKLTNIYWEYEIGWEIYKDYLTKEEQEYFIKIKTEKQKESLVTMQKIDNLCYFNQFQPIDINNDITTKLFEIPTDFHEEST